jgi:meiotically up-regulated gene 157 (Mug157) protein
LYGTFVWARRALNGRKRLLPARADTEILSCLAGLKASSAGTGFLHESFSKDDVRDFTRPWFAWANTLFGELILNLAKRKPELLFGQ